jgi:glycosyltransferase involved in cell wall biosynthesis
LISRKDRYGIGNHVINLCKALSDIGVESKLFNEKGNFATNLIPLNYKRELNDYDIIHIQGSPYGSEIDVLSPPKVLTVHTLLVDELKYESRLDFMVGRFFENRTIAKADKIIIVNDCLYKTMVSKFGIKELYTINNGVDIEEFDNIPSEKRQGVLYGGRISKRKNYDIIERASKKAKVFCAHFGGDRYYSREDQIKLYKNSKIFVCASDYETGPITVMEAMAAKCIVLAKLILGLVWALGYYIPFVDESDLVDKISVVISNYDNYLDMVNRAYEYVKKNFNWIDVAKKTVEVYRKVLE